MENDNPFVRQDDNDFDVLMAEKFYILTNIHKKWGMDGSYDAKITKVIFRGKAPWNRMDICVQSPDGRMQTIVGEFLEHYHPEDVQRFDVNRMFRRKEHAYGIEYEINV